MEIVPEKLAEHGILGIIILILIFTIARLFNLLQSSWEARNAEGLAAQKMQHDTLESVKGLTEVIRDLRRDAAK